MKRNLLGFLAVVLAIAVSSFTVKKAVNVYFIHGSGAQTVRSNYTETSSTQIPVNGNQILAWMRILDPSTTEVTDEEFSLMFETLDTVQDGNDTLDDDSEKIANDDEEIYEFQLEKKSA